MPPRSPIIFWLLLAATLAVDAVAIVWQFERPDAVRAAILYDALCFSQLSLACAWAVFAAPSRAVGGLVVAGAVTIAAVVTAILFDFQIGELLACFGAYALLVVLALWMVKHSQLWPAPPHEKLPVWQFSMLQLVALMTVVAVLLALFRSSELREFGEAIASDLVTNCLLVVGVALVWAQPWSMLARLALSLAVAVFFGLTSWGYDLWRADPLLNVGADDIPMYLAGGIIQTIVLSLWMGSGQILPPAVANSLNTIRAPSD